VLTSSAAAVYSCPRGWDALELLHSPPRSRSRRDARAPERHPPWPPRAELLVTRNLARSPPEPSWPLALRPSSSSCACSSEAARRRCCRLRRRCRAPPAIACRPCAWPGGCRPSLVGARPGAGAAQRRRASVPQPSPSLAPEPSEIAEANRPSVRLCVHRKEEEEGPTCKRETSSGGFLHCHRLM
jgi:hypothetical protein